MYLWCFCLQNAVAGLNKGFAANKEDLKIVESIAEKLESAGEPVDLTCNIDMIQGRWKLIYSSAFSSGTLGGSRPGPPTGRLLPITLGKVFILSISRQLLNVRQNILSLYIYGLFVGLSTDRCVI